METLAVVLQEPEHLVVRRLPLDPPAATDVVVDIHWSGISTGTERLLWSGRMPAFPGMGYPLVPGYESVGQIVEVGSGAPGSFKVGDWVFVPGARCFGAVRGLFGGAAARVVVAAERIIPIEAELADRGVLLALAATAYHALTLVPDRNPDLIVGHGVLGRLIARLAVLESGPNPVVWERLAERRVGADGYGVIDPEQDERRDYRRIVDVSGDPAVLDPLVQRLAYGGEILLAGFYAEPLSFSFPPAFMREARFQIAAQWQPEDLVTVKYLVESGVLSLDGLITHRVPVAQADAAYRTAFNDSACLKMVLDWRAQQ